MGDHLEHSCGNKTLVFPKLNCLRYSIHFCDISALWNSFYSFLTVPNISYYYHSHSLSMIFCLNKLIEHPKYCSRTDPQLWYQVFRDDFWVGLTAQSHSSSCPCLPVGSATVKEQWYRKLPHLPAAEKLLCCSQGWAPALCTALGIPVFPCNQPEKGFGRLQDEWLSRARAICPQTCGWSRMR